MIRKQKILTISLASWGIMLIGSGSIMQTMVKPIVKIKVPTIEPIINKRGKNMILLIISFLSIFFKIILTPFLTP